MAESYAVIGGDGFLGHTIVDTLVARYPTAAVYSLDIVQRYFPDKKQHTFISADLTSLESLSAALARSKPTCVFHTASPLGTGSSKEVCEKVNVVGTKTVVQACVNAGVKKLVYTSSGGVVYEGKDLKNVDERLPNPEVAMDPYNATKAEAEDYVLKANGKDGLLTVAIRPAGIFGPGDRQALPGVLAVLKGGKTAFQIGTNENLFDWTYVDNVVHGHILAAERLGQSTPVDTFETRYFPVSSAIPRRQLPTSVFRPESLLASEKKYDPSFVNNEATDPPLPAARNRFDQFASSAWSPAYAEAFEKGQLEVAGQAFFITNGEAVPFWDFPRAVWAAYNGHEAKWKIALPVDVGLLFASIGEVISKVLGREANLTRGKVVYSTVNRYYDIEKARRVLGYEPVVGMDEGIKRAVAWYKENEKTTAAAAKA